MEAQNLIACCFKQEDRGLGWRDHRGVWVGLGWVGQQGWWEKLGTNRCRVSRLLNLWAMGSQWQFLLLLHVPKPTGFPRLVHATRPLPQLLSIRQSCLSRKKNICFSDCSPDLSSTLEESSKEMFMHICEDHHFWKFISPSSLFPFFRKF